METTMKQIRRLFLLLCLITAGAQSAWAQFYHQQETVTINNQTYELSYSFSSYTDIGSHHAYLIDISGTNEEVVIPAKITNGGITYPVEGVGALIENNSMKTLRFQGAVDFYYSTNSWKPIGNSAFEYHECSGFIKSTSLQTIEFTFNISDWDKNGARLLCPNLRHIVFYGNAPLLSGTWSKYCTAPASNVTAVVPIWSEKTCENKQLTATVWCEFKGVVPSLDLVHDATLKSNGGGDVQIWKNKNNKSQLDYTMSSEGGEELVTFYGNVDSYQVRVFCSSDYSKPVLKRNGTEVNLDAASGYYYYDETSHMSVTSYEVVYNANYSRRLHFLNFGNGTVELSGESNGSAVSYVAEGMTETDYTFDKRTPVSVTITPQEGYKVQRIEHYGRIALPFDVNETTGVATTQYIFDDNESEQALKIYYQKKVIDVGTQFKLRMSVEGAGGAGAVFYSNDGSYYWIDDEIDDNGFGYQIDPGESDEVIGKYDPDDAIMDFYVRIYLTPAEAAAGFVTTVKVYANGGLVECSNPGTEWGDYYRIPLDGGDMDVRVVFESNGRYLTGENGNGGNVAIYCEGSNTPLRIEAPGYWFWTLIPKTANPYVVITPIAGKTVVAVVRDGKLLSSLNNYRQSDGTYRIPLEGFDKGDSGYPLYVVYGDDISSVPIIEWNLLMVGDVDEANNENPKANVLWMVGGDELLLASEGESLKASCNIDKTWYVPVDTYLDFNIYVKPGQTFKVSFNGTDVTNIFVRKADYDNDDGTLCYVYEARGYEQFATSGTWVVEFKKPEGITWTGMITGDTEKDFCMFQVMLNNNAIDYNISAMEGCPYDTFKKQFVGNASELLIDFIAKDGYDFKLSFNGTEFPYEFTKELYFEEESLYDYRFRTTDADLIAPFLVDGTWVLTYKKVAEAGITWDGLIIGDVPQGATVDIGLADMKMEVFLNAEETSASDSYAGSTERIGMSAVITAPAGYNFKVWFNGEEKTDRFDENGVYDITSGYEEELAPYLQDGQWIVLFYDDLERYDLNHDKKVDIADVTTMVNKVLENDKPSSNP